MTQTQLSLFPTARSDGQKPSENSSACSIQVKFPNGTCQSYDLPVHLLKPLVAEAAGLTHSTACLNSLLNYLEGEQGESSHPLSVTIWSAKQQRLSLSEVSDDQP